MDRRSYLRTAGAAVATGLFAGCSGGGSDGGSGGDGSSDGDSGGTTYGTLSTSVTDQPTDIGDFQSCVVTLQGLWIKPAGSEGDEETEMEGTETEADDEEMTAENETEATEQSATPTEEATEEGEEATEEEEEEDTEEEEEDDNGRRYIEFDEAQSADLVELQGSNTQLIEETEVETGEYEFLQLDVSGIEGTLEDGSAADVETPGNAPLKFNQSFEVRESERTQFIADFTPVKRGNGSYIIQPVASGTTVLYGDEEYQGGDESESTADTTETDADDESTATETEAESGSGSGNGNGNGGNN